MLIKLLGVSVGREEKFYRSVETRIACWVRICARTIELTENEAAAYEGPK